MSENEAVFFKLDMQPAIAALIFANDGRCGGDEGAWVSCDGKGEGSCFPGTPCPLEGMLFRGIIPCPCWGKEQRVVAAKDWLEKYHQQKAEAAKKQEQAVKPEPKKICGTCSHVLPGIIDLDVQQIVLCGKKGRSLPVLHEGCPDFEPRTREKSVFERMSAVIKSMAEADEAHSKFAAAYLSQIANTTQLADTEERKEMQGEAGCRWVFRPSATLPPDVSVSDVICAFMASAPPRKPSACAAKLEADRIAQLEKENAELQSTNKRLREELVWQFEQLTKKVGTLQDRNAQLREKLAAAIEDVKSKDGFLVEQFTQAVQRIEELEREAGERSWPPRPRFFL